MSGLAKAHGMPSEPMVLAIATLDSPPQYIEIANLGDITGSSSRTVQDVSAHGGTARRKIATLYDGGSYACTIFFIPTPGIEDSHTDDTNGIQAIYERNDLRAYALFYRDGATANTGTARYFNAYITKLSEKLPVAGVLTADIEFTVDGEVLRGTEEGGIGSGVFAPPEA